jgi:hypothetical protein
VIVRVSNAGIRIEKPDDLDQLKVAVAISTVDPVKIIREARAGELVDGDAWIAIAWIRANCGSVTWEGWEARFREMLSGATAQGRLSADGQSIVAHVVTSP